MTQNSAGDMKIQTTLTSAEREREREEEEERGRERAGEGERRTELSWITVMAPKVRQERCFVLVCSGLYLSDIYKPYTLF